MEYGLQKTVRIELYLDLDEFRTLVELTRFGLGVHPNIDDIATNTVKSLDRILKQAAL